MRVCQDAFYTFDEMLRLGNAFGTNKPLVSLTLKPPTLTFRLELTSAKRDYLQARRHIFKGVGVPQMTKLTNSWRLVCSNPILKR